MAEVVFLITNDIYMLEPLIKARKLLRQTQSIEKILVTAPWYLEPQTNITQHLITLCYIDTFAELRTQFSNCDIWELFSLPIGDSSEIIPTKINRNYSYLLDYIHRNNYHKVKLIFVDTASMLQIIQSTLQMASHPSFLSEIDLTITFIDAIDLSNPCLQQDDLLPPADSGSEELIPSPQVIWSGFPRPATTNSLCLSPSGDEDSQQALLENASSITTAVSHGASSSSSILCSKGCCISVVTKIPTSPKVCTIM